jgi:SH3-like domain-containing protein
MRTGRSGRVRALVLAALLAAAGLAPIVGRADEAEARGPVTNLPLPRFVSIRAETANARRGPSLSHRVDWEFLRRGWPVEVTAEYGHWRRVRDVDGVGGWVHYTLLSGQRTVLVRGDGQVPLRAEPSETGEVRAMAEPGVVAALGECEASWCRVSAEGIEGWVARGALWGVAEAAAPAE